MKNISLLSENFQFLEMKFSIYLNSITKTCLFKYMESFTSKKTKIFQIKNSDIFHISAQNTDCGHLLGPPRRGGSNEYPQSMFYAEIRKIMYTPVHPSFTIKRWGLRGSKLYRHVFVMACFCIGNEQLFLSSTV